MAILNKKDIRRKMLRQREQMDNQEVQALSQRIMGKLKKLPVYKTSKTIMLYLSFENEVDSTRIIEDCLEDGKRVVMPYCSKSDMSITPTEIKNLDLDLSENSMGYKQSKKDSLKPVDISEIDLIVIPGIAFDRKGYRVGFGAGYYDRFLGKVNFEIPTIGLAYDFQIVDSFIKMEDYDIPVDYVMTENRIIIRTE